MSKSRVKPRSKSSANPSKIRAENGISDDSLLTAIAQATVLRSHLKAPTIDGHKRELARYREMIHGLEAAESVFGRSFLSTLPGSPSTLDACFMQGASFPPNGVIHAFLDFRCAGMLGKRDGRVSIHSIESAFRTFCSAMSRATGSYATRDIRESCISYIRSVLVPKYKLNCDGQERIVPDAEVFDVLANVALSDDFRPRLNRFRVQWFLVNAIQIATGSRIGAILRSSSSGYSSIEHDQRALLYGDTRIVISRAASDELENIITVEVRLRNTKTEEGKGRGAVLVEQVPAYRNGALLFLSLAIEDGAIAGDPSTRWLLNPDMLGTCDQKVLVYKSEWSTVPVIRAFSYDEGPDNSPSISASKALHATVHNSLTKDLCALAGFTEHFTSHALRAMAARSALKSGATLVDVQYALGHKLGGDMIKAYLSKTSTLDIASTVFTSDSQSSKIAKLGSMMVTRAPGAPTVLSQAARQQLLDDPEVLLPQQQQAQYLEILQAKNGTLDRSSEEEQAKYRSFYNTYDLAYKRLYRYYLAGEQDLYHEQYNAIPIEPITTASTSALYPPSLPPPEDPIADDLPPLGAHVFYDTSAVSLSLSSLDFERADFAFQLSAGGGSSDFENSQLLAQLQDSSIAALIELSSTNEDARVLLRSISLSDSPMVQDSSLDIDFGTSEFDLIFDEFTHEYTNDKGYVSDFSLNQFNIPELSQTLDLSKNLASPLVPVAILVDPIVSEFNDNIGVVPSSSRPLGPDLPLSSSREESSRNILQGIVPRPAHTDSTSSSYSATAPGDENSSSTSALLNPALESKVDNTIPSHPSSLKELSDHLQDTALNLSKVSILQSLQSLPEFTRQVVGFWPGLVPLEDGRCRTCLQKPEDVTTGQATEHKDSQWRVHLYECNAEKIREEFWDENHERFEGSMNQNCPYCPVEEEEDDSSEPVVSKKRKNRRVTTSGPKKVKTTTKTPRSWTKHFRDSHSGTTSCCSCGGRIHESVTGLVLHALEFHNIVASEKEPKNRPLEIRHLNLPPFCLLDNSFHPDPIEWENFSRDRILPLFSDKIIATNALLANPSAGSQLGLSTMSTSITSEVITFSNRDEPLVSQPNSVVDNRYTPIMTHTKGKVASQFGRCITCIHDSTLTSTDRTVQLIHPLHERHSVTHLIHQYLDEIKSNSSTMTYNCPDVLCPEINNLSLFQLANHFSSIHGALFYEDSTKSRRTTTPSRPTSMEELRVVLYNFCKKSGISLAKKLYREASIQDNANIDRTIISADEGEEEGGMNCGAFNCHCINSRL